jgi:hypothetical protein
MPEPDLNEDAMAAALQVLTALRGEPVEIEDLTADEARFVLCAGAWGRVPTGCLIQTCPDPRCVNPDHVREEPA